MDGADSPEAPDDSSDTARNAETGHSFKNRSEGAKPQESVATRPIEPSSQASSSWSKESDEPLLKKNKKRLLSYQDGDGDFLGSVPPTKKKPTEIQFSETVHDDSPTTEASVGKDATKEDVDYHETDQENESESDGEKEVFSGMEQPPLINQLKRILAEYPDGGQILKELIQNAEDAGATEFKLLYDQRNINPTIRGGKEYRKFFRGPALCVYNNALFQPEDWKGIMMIDMSVKESQPLKVGRFGLGFKSVFHLTDYPCVLSNDRILLIDPQKGADKVNAVMELNKLERYKRMDVEAFYTALDGSFGIDREIIKKGSFEGTLFWFPLRSTASKLSPNVYGRDNVMALLESIKNENQTLIIFLKSLTSIRIDLRTQNQRETHVVVEIDNAQEVCRKRKRFRDSIDKLIKYGGTGEAIVCDLEMKINTSILMNDGLKWEKASVNWLVISCFMGNNASVGFQHLIKDKELGLSPYASVGAPLSSEKIDGHVFCFLPLPREDTSLTGLPVHTNGFFALNQSRHHVKWSTEEQSDHYISDKNVLWNKYLISEQLPLVYKFWFEKVLLLASNSQNDDNLIETIHRAIPVSDHVQGKWQELLSPLFRHLREMRILYSRNQNVWVTVPEALFPSEQYRNSDDCQTTVVTALTQMNKNFVELPFNLVETLCEYFKLDKGKTFITPLLLSQLLKADKHHSYKSMSLNEKMTLIDFLFQDNSILSVEGLELLPLVSGRWTCFNSNTEERVYMCDPEDVKLFPGMEDKILLQKSNFPEKVFKHFEKISQSGTFQLKALDQQSEIEAMLHGVLDLYLPNKTDRTINTTNRNCNFIWIQNIWKYLLKNAKVSICEGVPLIPLLINGNWKVPKEVNLVKATNKLIMKEQNKNVLHDGVEDCLRALSVDVVPSLPDWLPFRELQPYIYLPNPESVIEILSSKTQDCSNEEKQQLVNSFNNIDKTLRIKFMEYVCNATVSETHCKQLLMELKMFESLEPLNANNDMFSINDNVNFVGFDKFPVSLQTNYINGSGKGKRLLQQLGCLETKHSDIVVMTLAHINNGKYDERDTLTFMNYLVENFIPITNLCSDKNKNCLIQNARKISFLKTKNGLKKPSDLFENDQLLEDFFKAEFVFPEIKLTNTIIQTLLILGLKTPKHIIAEDVASSARLLDSWSRNGKHVEEASLKSKAIMRILSNYPQLLEQTTDGVPLKQTLADLEIIEPMRERTATYPNWLSWYSHSNLLCKPSEVKGKGLASLVGSVMPVIDVDSDQVSDAFLWGSNIPTHILTKQLENVQDMFKAKYRPYLLDYLQQLYNWLTLNMLNLEEWKNVKFIWVDKLFCTPNEIITNKLENDINLEPYFFNVPAEFEQFSVLFEHLGCYRHQNIDVLTDTLSKMQQKKDISMCSLIVDILNRLSEKVNEMTVETKNNILIPIHFGNDEDLKFKRLEDCTYCDDPDEYFSDDEDESEEDTIYFVHKSVHADIAVRLGIRSLQRRHLINTEEVSVEEWGQREPLTTRLKTLIEEGYIDGLSVPKELLQNADDAGATCLKFLYDERENYDAMDSLLNQGMKTCHGPSLWVFNDAKFSDKDFVNITKLNAATKKQNMQTIGKFGLGFCSVYNLTDVPSIVSGSNIVIFDPHKTHLKDSLSGSSPGLKIDLSKKGNIKLLKRNKDQFKPYNGIFGCDLSSKTPHFDGTLFRLPLRSTEESKLSEIKTEPYTQRDVSELLALFIDNAINLLLFTQNVQTIEVYHMKSSAEGQELLFSVCRSLQHHQECLEYKSILSHFTSNQNTISEIQRIDISFKVFDKIQNIKPKLKIKPTSSLSTWVLSWATGTREIKALLQDPYFNSNLPLTAVAVPLNEDISGTKCLSKIGIGSFKTGRLYCFLPIPCDIQQLWHLHGCFDVTSDRRQLKVATEQDKPTQRVSWNNCLMEDAGTNAFIQLLEYLTQIPSMSNYVFHKLWPIQSPDTMKPFVKSFFKRIVTEDFEIFKAANGWLSFKNIVILDPDVRENKTIGEIAYTMLQHFQIRQDHDTVIIDLPRHVLKALRMNNEKEQIRIIDSKIVGDEEMLMLFFMNIADSFWGSHIGERNNIVKYALNTEYTKIQELIKNTKCIEAVNSSDMKKPEELIHPSSLISSMFCDEDCLFPAFDFREKSTLDALVNHGMIYQYLPIGMLLQRIQSIETFSSQCTVCSKDRIKSIVAYLNTDNIIGKYEEYSFHEIRDTAWLPVLQKTHNWNFSWFADKRENMSIFPEISCHLHREEKCELLLGKTCKIYGFKDIDFIACVSNVIDETDLGNKNPHVWQMIGIMNNDSEQGFQNIVNQLNILAKEYDPKSKYTSYSRIYRKAVQVLHTSLIQNEDRKLILKQIYNTKFVLVNHKELIKPCQVAFEVKEPCYPFLCQLPDDYRQFSEFYTEVGVVKCFSIESILNALNNERYIIQDKKKDTIDQVIRILQNLVDYFERHNKTYMDYKEHHYVIVGPDITGQLYPTHELALDDITFTSSVKMKIIHDAFQRDLAKKLGVKSKKDKCLEQISLGIPWGQKEKLETRIQGILENYPCDDSILKELLQNADDANAKELHFIMDFRKHSTDTIVGNGNLQEPSLCVYNDGFFTEEDLNGITHLGIGSKRKDASKTGQFGIGFNAVYHLTDTPSFLTKGPGLGDGVLCILDPLCCDLPVDDRNPGLRFSRKEIEENFPSSLSGFLEKNNFFNAEKGTMFRFPLRKKASALSVNTLTDDGLSNLLKEFSENILDVLLFVKNVERIKISRIADEQLLHVYALSINISEEDRQNKNLFFRQIKDICMKNKEFPLNNLHAGQIDVQYVVEVNDSKGYLAKWLIIQTFGCFEGEIINERIIEAFQDDQLRHLPLGGVAVPYPDFQNSLEDQKAEEVSPSGNCMHDTMYSNSKYEDKISCESQEMNVQQSNIGKFFAFLPLPVKTGFRVHINANFSLDHSRRDIWKEGYRDEWNKFLGEKIIVVSWINALKYLHRYFTETSLSKIGCSSEKQIIEMANKYHALFPVSGNLNHNLSKLLLNHFYMKVYIEDVALFPTIKSDNNQSFSVQWVSLKTNSKMFGAVFKARSTGHTVQLHQVLKNLGMDLIETPLQVYTSLKALECPDILLLDPDFVITFLSSFQSNEPGSCCIGNIGTPIEDTCFLTIENLKCVVEYVFKALNLHSKVEKLPILPTADNRLNTMNKYSSIYNSPFHNLLPSSKSVFVHPDFIGHFNNNIFLTEKFLKSLDVSSFKTMLQLEAIDDFRSGLTIDWDKTDHNNFITPAWVKRFFAYIEQNSQELDLPLTAVLEESFKQLSFLPAIYKYSNGSEYKLLPFSMAYKLYEHDIFHEERVNEILNNLDLPKLDDSLFVSNNIKRNMCEIIANTRNPMKLLKCLHHHIKNIEESNLTPENASSLLSYFERHIVELRDVCSKQFLKDLPLHLSHDNKLLKIDTRNILILPSGIPVKGIQDWAISQNKIVLCKKNSLKGLYDYLEVLGSNKTEFYAQFLVPTIDSLPQQYWITHFRVMRSLISETNNTYARPLLLKLQKLPLFIVGNQRKQACELYWHDNEVFEVMLDDHHFPPLEYRNIEWREFCKSLNMQFEVNDQLMIDFARRIEQAGQNNVSEKTKEQSKVLLSHFINQFWPYLKRWDDKTLTKLKSVKFICPYNVDENLKTICDQPDSSKRLISFSQSISVDHKLLCWSSMNILSNQPSHKSECVSLGIYQDPPVDRVILHCQNIATLLQDKLEKGKVKKELVQQILEHIYVYFDNIKATKDMVKVSNRLETFPLVYLPLHNVLVKAKAVIIEMPIKNEIKPYLYKAPLYYGKYFDLFAKLGSKQEFDICHCVYILQELKLKTCDNILLVEELHVVAQVLKKVVEIVKSKRDIDSIKGPLYIPNRQKVLKDSRYLTISNNDQYERLLQNRTEIEYALPLNMFEIYSDPAIIFRKLPDSVRPTILVDVVSHMILDERIQKVDNLKAIELQEFFHSNEFIEGFLRLVIFHLNKHGKEFDYRELVSDITGKIRQIQVVSALNLTAVVFFKGEMIQGTEIERNFFVKRGNSEYIFYVSDNEISKSGNGIVHLNRGIVKLLKMCIGYEVNWTYFTEILNKFGDQDSIREVVDDMQIGCLQMGHRQTSTIFPKPGIRVEEHFLPFLEEAIVPFIKEEYKFVAMELEESILGGNVDEISELHKSVYIYVQIVKEIDINPQRSDLHKVYLVNTGNVHMSFERVPIFRLYRFVRRRDESADLVQHDTEPVGAIAFDETCKRIRDMLQEAWSFFEPDRKRIIRRLILKWHPDKNRGNEEYCKEIFNYIKSVILLLEKGEQVSTIIDRRNFRSAPNMSDSSYHNLVQNVSRQGTVYASAYHDNVDDYSRSYRSGRYRHTSNVRPAQPDISEARRWMRQAKMDYRAANTFNTQSMEGHNWICYTCHQACEKALRAAHFSKDANKVPGRTHSLWSLTNSFKAEINNIVQEFENRLQDYNRMRYPNAVSRPNIPSDLYTEDDAKFALQKTRELIDAVENEFDLG